MGNTVIKVENLSKQYRLGEVGTGTISHDLNRWWHRIRGREDPYLRIGESNDRTSKGNSEYVWALQDINFEVQQGEVLGIIGKNGAGKSTLLKILSKVTAPTTGSIKAKGRIASLLEVGTGFHPELTGRENIYLNGTILGMSKREVIAKLDEIVDFAGVERYLDTPVKRYSSGMMVRLGFAVAAHLEPEILIVDEVLAVGDAEFQKKAVGKMQKVSKEGGRTVLFVSHNMGSVLQICQTAMIIQHGTLIDYGATSSMVKEYLKNFKSGRDIYLADENQTTKFAFFKKVKLKLSGNQVIVSCSYVLCRDINCVIAVKCKNEEGTDLFTTIDTDLDTTAFQKKQGSYSFEFTFDISSFVEGTYYLTFSISDMKSERFDFLEDELNFNISQNKNTLNNFIGRKGIIIPRIEWKKIEDHDA